MKNEYKEKDADVLAYIDNINKSLEEETNKILTSSDIELKITDENGVRLVRTRETCIGNLIADAFRVIGKVDIGIVNGGDIRANLKSGELSYKDIKSVTPFGNMQNIIEATGQQILDYLEYTCRKVQSKYVDDEGKAVGEFGAFPSVSGLRFKVNTSIPSSVKLDENDICLSIEGERRVYDVYVLVNGEYVPIDKNKTYTISTLDYISAKSGDGISVFKDCKVIGRDLKPDHEVLVDYISNVLNGKLSEKYSKTEGRITIE